MFPMLHCLQYFVPLIRFSHARILAIASPSPSYWVLSSPILAFALSLMNSRVVCHVGIGKAGSSFGSILKVFILRSPFFLAWAAWFSKVLASEVFENWATTNGFFFLSWPHISILVLLGRLSPLSLKTELTLLKRFLAWIFRSESLTN